MPTLNHSMKQYLEKRGFYRNISSTIANQLFIEHGTYYLSGFVSIAFLSTLADEILYANLQKENALSPVLFGALTCAADPPSTPQKRVVWHQKLKTYLEELKNYEQEDTQNVYVEN